MPIEFSLTLVSVPKTLGQFGINREGVAHGHVRANLMWEDPWHAFLGLATPTLVPLAHFGEYVCAFTLVSNPY